MWRDSLALRGRLQIVEWELWAGRESIEVISNLTVLAGKKLVAKLLFGQSQAYLLAFACGQNVTAPAVGDIALIDERVRGQLTSVTLADNVVTVRFFMGTTQGNGFTFREAGLFNSLVPGQGEMYARAVHNDKVKDASKVLLYQWTLTIG